MSGGSLDYFFSALNEHVGDFNDKELDDLVKDLSDLFYAREWFLSGDTNEGTWREARDKFKAKWFDADSRDKRIRAYIDSIRDELLDSFGVSERYCKDCLHWTKEEDKSSPYGKCDMMEHCLMHRSESCDKFVKNDPVSAKEFIEKHGH